MVNLCFTLDRREKRSVQKTRFIFAHQIIFLNDIKGNLVLLFLLFFFFTENVFLFFFILLINSINRLFYLVVFILTDSIFGFNS